MDNNKVIVTIAPLGNVPTKDLNPYTPITIDEIVETTYRCHEAGASIVHIHARDNDGNPTTDSLIFENIIDRIKSCCNIITQVSTGARGGSTLEERSAPLCVKPEMASLATGSSNFSNSINANSPDLIKGLSQIMIDFNIKPEIEVFDASMISNAEYLEKSGLLQRPLHFNLVMNVPGSIKGTPANLFHLYNLLPENSTFTVSGIGKSHSQMINTGLSLGGNVRVGIEDVIELKKGQPVSNLFLVERVVGIIKAMGKEVATPDEAREILSFHRA